MKCQIKVKFNEADSFEFECVSNEADRPTAREWLMDEYQEQECTPKNPVGKILILDMILQIAESAGVAPFREKNAWAYDYLKAVANVMARPLVLIDVKAMKVG